MCVCVYCVCVLVCVSYICTLMEMLLLIVQRKKAAFVRSAGYCGAEFMRSLNQCGHVYSYCRVCVMRARLKCVCGWAD